MWELWGLVANNTVTAFEENNAEFNSIRKFALNSVWNAH